MKGYDQYDISGYSFDEFADFVFKRDVVLVHQPGDGKPEPWYWHAEVTYDARRVLGFYVQLFQDPEFLLS